MTQDEREFIEKAIRKRMEEIAGQQQMELEDLQRRYQQALTTAVEAINAFDKALGEGEFQFRSKSMAVFRYQVNQLRYAVMALNALPRHTTPQ